MHIEIRSETPHRPEGPLPRTPKTSPLGLICGHTNLPRTRLVRQRANAIDLCRQGASRSIEFKDENRACIFRQSGRVDTRFYRGHGSSIDNFHRRRNQSTPDNEADQATGIRHFIENNEQRLH